MEFYSIDRWDEKLWQKIKEIYAKAFERGAKPEKILRKMFAKNMCSFHVGMKRDIVVSFALTGSIDCSRILLIDYFAVHPDSRNLGHGRNLFQYIKKWSQGRYNKIILEVESEQTPENLARIKFWQSCGFILETDYTHKYIWVPEPYQIMWLDLMGHRDNSINSEELFKNIGDFHKESFR